MPDHPFGLRENPFAEGYDPRTIYPADKRVEAVALLRRRIADGEPFVTVTGEPGCGKTSVVTELLEDADIKAKVAFIAHPSLTPSELVEAVCIEFEAPLPNPPSKPQALASLDRRLRDLKQQGFCPVLVLDEAHGLKTELLEEARLLSNMKADGRALLQTILVGLPELERRMGLPELAQLRQRVGVHCRLAPLTLDETRGYLQHRVSAAGGDGEAIFPAPACQEVYDYTNGLPRDINTLAGRAIECAGNDGADAVGAEHVRMAAGDARPHGIATAPRAPAGSQPFELRRTVHLARPAAPVARALERPPVPAPIPIARVVERPVERTVERPPAPDAAAVARAIAPPVEPPAPVPVAVAPQKPPSFLRAQHVARSGGTPAPESKGSGPALEGRFRSGGVTTDVMEGGRDPSARGGLLGSESTRELGVSVLLVGLLVVVLIATGRWDPVVRSPETPVAGLQSDDPRVAIPPATTRAAGIRSEPVAEPSPAPVDPPPPPIAAPEPAVTEAPSAPPAPSVAPATPAASMPDLTLGAARGAQRGIGFEVASTVSPDSAAVVLRKIQKGSKLPVRMVTKATGDPYRVVVGPFQTRREAEKAISELFRHALVERARIVQLVD